MEQCFCLCEVFEHVRTTPSSAAWSGNGGLRVERGSTVVLSGITQILEGVMFTQGASDLATQSVLLFDLGGLMERFIAHEPFHRC